MKYTIVIKDKNERVSFAAELEKIITDAKFYIPGKLSKSVFQCDVGIVASVTKEILAQIDALIDRRGHRVYKTEGSELTEPSPFRSITTSDTKRQRKEFNYKWD